MMKIGNSPPTKKEKATEDKLASDPSMAKSLSLKAAEQQLHYKEFGTFSQAPILNTPLANVELSEPAQARLALLSGLAGLSPQIVLNSLILIADYALVNVAASRRPELFVAGWRSRRCFKLHNEVQR